MYIIFHIPCLLYLQQKITDVWKLNRHKENIHKESRFKCDKCVHECSDEYHLRRHIERCSTGASTSKGGKPKSSETTRVINKKSKEALNELNKNPKIKQNVIKVLAKQDN